MGTNKQKLNKVFEQVTKNKQIHEATLLVENIDGDFSYSNEYGGKSIDTPMLMASITKLFTTTCILILKEQGLLSLDDKVSKYIKEDTIRNLHIYKDQEYSMDLTLYNLLFQTSGLPAVYDEGSAKAKKRAIHQDEMIFFDEIITMTKLLKPHIAPNKKNKAYYANINFDLLGEIIEEVTNSSLEDIYKQFIFKPLGLKSTYLIQSDDDFVPNVYYKNSTFNRPKSVRSGRASGGGISTVRELMIFIKAFYGGSLFNENIFFELKEINKLQPSMFLIHYGAGYMRIPLNGLTSLFMGKGELIGHSGSTGSFAFYYPLKDLFFVGDVNQMSNPALPIRLIMRLAFSMKS